MYDISYLANKYTYSYDPPDIVFVKDVGKLMRACQDMAFKIENLEEEVEKLKSLKCYEDML
jgi:hypothetical protein